MTPSPGINPDPHAERLAAARDSASREAASSVAEAVKRVADAAVAEVQKNPSKVEGGDFTFSGSPGGRFTIRGNNLGSSGTVKLGNRQLNTREWGTFFIHGDLPSDAKPGEVTVALDSDTIRRGIFRG